jgi:hypothetical protein
MQVNTGFFIQVPSYGVNYSFTLGQKDKFTNKLIECVNKYGETNVYFSAQFDKLKA